MMKRAIVIGASSGIGKEVAQNLINEGWTVGLAARRDGLMLSMMHATPDRVKVAKIDVNASNAADELNKLIKRIGGMDLFFYAAGIGKQNRELVEEPELATVRTNALGFTRMIGVAYRYFAEKGEGHIAAITSIAGTKGLGPSPAYSATKAMQNVYIQALEQQAHARGLNIYFTDIRPGFVNTALLNGDFHYPMMMQPEDVAQKIISAIRHKKHICVINWKYRLLTMLWRRIPRFIWRRLRL
jgi:short-subunit dehydrogenase